MTPPGLSARILASAWALIASLMAPFLPFYLRRRVAKGKEIAERLPERQGHGAARPPGRLVWCHAASNGETLSLLPLLAALAKQDPALSFLVTTGTVTSAHLLEQRLSPELAPRTQHRFLPLDVPRWVARFLAGWRPDLAVIVESELWPNMLAAAGRQGVPLALINARMSARSARNWGWAAGFARALLGRFALILAQTEADAARFSALAGREAPCWGNLKYAAPPLPADPAELARLQAAWAGRPVWLAASTHPGEDEIIIAAHRLLAAEQPRLLTVIVPRHPPRGPDIAALAGDLPAARRGAGQEAGQGAGIYVADTLGELGLFYRLAQVALIGGSLVAHGGQNPLEAARLGCPILIGPHHFNFSEIISRLRAAHALAEIPDGAVAVQALAAQVARLLADPAAGQAMAGAAAALAQDQAGLPGRIATSLLPLIHEAR
ncbi:MAG: 3-deoxy-D-manno-octulosonic acid transferase [Roseomonas sp.]|nr:3-deoxy-D-manno-octulosonic acid transferase [Roseomonas sp.]